MALGREDATRIVRFCLAGDGWGSATYEGDAHVLKLLLNGAERTDTRRFEGKSFEDVLAQAVAAGVLKESCVAKQISFLQRTTASPPATAREDDDPSTEPATVDAATLFPELTAVVSALVHQTQRERGISSLYAASGGRRYAEELAAQWRATDRRHEELAAFRERNVGRLFPAIAEQLAEAETLLGSLTASRGSVEDLALPPTDIIDTYTRVNGELLRIVDGMLSRAVEPPQRSTALAWMALLYAKEKTGIERAQLVSAFERDRYFEGQYQAVLGVIAARQSYLHLFAAAAPPTAGELLRTRMESDIADAVERMERVALAHRRGGFGIDPTTWFVTISRQIELYGDVESAVRGLLTRGHHA